MMNRNIDDYKSRSGRLVRDDGTVVNEANGINDDGSRNVKIAGAEENSGGSLGVVVKNQAPVDVQNRYSQTIMTHNGVTVNASASTTRVEVNTKGYSKAVLIVNCANGSGEAKAEAIMTNGSFVTGGPLSRVTRASIGNNLGHFDLNGIEKISVYGTDTSGATNAITIEVSLMV